VTFSPTYWEPQFHGYLYLIEFLETKWKRDIRLPNPPTDPRGELDGLLRMKDDPEERAKHLAAIIAQNNEFPFSFFSRSLLFSAASHPKTYELIWSAIIVGRAVVMFYKDYYNRPRPSQLEPRLDPAIDIPGHPAYPSGHSTQMHLAAYCLAAVVPGAKVSKVVTDFAGEVARNRERAGLHYRSDTEAGIKLATQMFKILQRCSGFSATLVAARSEWITRTPASPRARTAPWTGARAPGRGRRTRTSS
jgi:hypothetical protein